MKSSSKMEIPKIEICFAGKGAERENLMYPEIEY